MARTRIDHILGEISDANELAALDISASAIFDKVARLAAHLADRSEARVVLVLRDQYFSIGQHGDSGWFSNTWGRSVDLKIFPPLLDIPDGDAFFGVQTERVFIDGKEFKPSCMTFVGLGTDGARYGALLVFDFEKKGALSPEVKDELMLVGKLVSHLIEVNSSIRMLKRDLDQLLD